MLATYDDLGNPLYYHNGYGFGKNFTWTGRQLTGMTQSGTTQSFTYNDEGIRTSKTVNGVTTTYYLSGSQIIAEETSGNLTVYIYDASGSPIGMQYHGSSYAEDVWDVFWYEKNLQGDIVAVYNDAGTKLVTYYYDAFGYCIVGYDNNGSSTRAYYNPFRYRGYYYDKDLDLYYLNARYYDGRTGRFISPDNPKLINATPGALTDKNLYAYCDNNPVMRVDKDGEIWNILIGAGAGAFAGFITGIIGLALDKEAPKINTWRFWAHIGVSTFGGAISGGLAASSVGLAGQIIGNAIIGGTGALLDTRIDDTGDTSVLTYILRIAEGATIGALAGRIGNKGSASKHVSNHFHRVLHTHNFRYYFTQINVQAVKDGLKSIPSIAKATIPTLTKIILKAFIQEES